MGPRGNQWQLWVQKNLCKQELAGRAKRTPHRVRKTRSDRRRRMGRRGKERGVFLFLFGVTYGQSSLYGVIIHPFIAAESPKVAEASNVKLSWGKCCQSYSLAANNNKNILATLILIVVSLWWCSRMLNDCGMRTSRRQTSCVDLERMLWLSYKISTKKYVMSAEATQSCIYVCVCVGERGVWTFVHPISQVVCPPLEG